MFLVAIFLVLPVLWLLLTNWQLTLLALGIWMLMRITMGMSIRGRELPAPAYPPRWTAGRRLSAKRELAQWQAWFDAR